MNQHDGAFYTDDSLPCESCGHLTTKREWNAEHELWVGLDCTCSLPDQPICQLLIPIIMAAETVGELVDSCREHRKSCPLCGLRELKPVVDAQEPDWKVA